MIQKQKGFSAPVLALSVWTAALAEEMQTGISPRGMIIHGAVQALLLTCISGVFSACWQRAAMQWIWLFSAGAWFLAELFGTVMQAQNICQQEFRSMALIGLLPLLLWAGWCIPPSGWDAPARVLWWFVLLGEGLCLAGIAGQMEWSHLLEPDAVQLARLPRVPLYAEYLLWPLLMEETAPRRILFLPWLTFLAQVCLAGGVAANGRLRQLVNDGAQKLGAKVYLPELKFCGDNGAMIAAQGYYQYIAGHTAGLELNGLPTLPIDYE